jgi:hypothetical protein
MTPEQPPLPMLGNALRGSERHRAARLRREADTPNVFGVLDRLAALKRGRMTALEFSAFARTVIAVRRQAILDEWLQAHAHELDRAHRDALAAHDAEAGRLMAKCVPLPVDSACSIKTIIAAGVPAIPVEDPSAPKGGIRWYVPRWCAAFVTLHGYKLTSLEREKWLRRCIAEPKLRFGIGAAIRLGARP